MGKLGIILFFGSFILAVAWFSQQNQICEHPLHYRIGRVDDRFNISYQGYRQVIQEAGAVWEKAFGQTLFVYDPAAPFVVNLIYDERQQDTVASQQLSRNMQLAEDSNQKIRTRHDYWQEIYQTRSKALELSLNDFQKRLKTYNETVEAWHSKGGVPPTEYEAVNAEREAIDRARKELDTEHKALEEIHQTLESLESRSDSLVASYNQNAYTYNSLYGTQTPFHKGEYDGQSISIFQFHNRDDLRLVLAHEMGHALGLTHIDAPEAIMHAMMGSQNLDNLAPTPADVEALQAACGQGN